eukprot:TRINITY_DN2991_c1_g2_i1.p1 TRINITY_DN2991_c1_g2~~TRINITY_DN2991_c1_g2_i1.p1  ORF type:complete len:432 (+),score=92.86 TRINITY_DN2991_c1_g2_i1:74-1369(+)
MKQFLIVLTAATIASQADEYVLGAQGDSCAYVCGTKGKKCLLNIETNDSTTLLQKLGAQCNGTKNNGVRFRGWEPAYISDPTHADYTMCLGYKDLPTQADYCNGHDPSAQRLCHCGDDETYRYHFGTGLANWFLPARETNAFFHRVPPGSTGVITHLWTTCVKECVDALTIRIYIDGEATPSIDMSPLMAAGVGFNDSHAPWGTKWMGLGAGNGGNGQAWFNNFRIPFTKSIRVTLHHQSGAPFGGFYFIVRGARDMPIQVGGYTLPKTAKLLLQKFEGELQPLEWLAVTDVKSGSGIHFASTIAVASNDLNFLEGCYHSFSPYNESFPGVLLSTGTEDYFDSGWYFNAGTFRFPVSGNTHLVSGNGKVTWSAYRMHDQDPLFFNDGLRVLWRNGDVLDPTMKTKCYTQKGITVGNPTVSTVVSYAWVYVW